MHFVRRHPRTGNLLRPIGVWRGRVIWPVMGASEPAPEPGPAPAPSPTPQPAPPAPAPTPQPTPQPAPGPSDPDDHTDWKAEARKWEQRSKDNKAKADKLDELEAANATELEKAQKTAQDSEERARAATLRAAKAEVKTLAGKFADPDDAVLYLGDLAQYINDDGEVDTKAVKTALDKVIENKPHLAKAEPKLTPTPKPGVPVPNLRPGAAPDEPQRASSLTDAITRRLTT